MSRDCGIDSHASHRSPAAPHSWQKQWGKYARTRAHCPPAVNLRGFPLGRFTTRGGEEHYKVLNARLSCTSMHYGPQWTV